MFEMKMSWGVPWPRSNYKQQSMHIEEPPSDQAPGADRAPEKRQEGQVGTDVLVLK